MKLMIRYAVDQKYQLYDRNGEKSREMYNEIDLDKIDITLGPPAKEPARQYYFIARCREWVRDFEQRNGRVPNSCVTTFGCQMNARDSEKLEGVLKQAGFAAEPDERRSMRRASSPKK